MADDEMESSRVDVHSRLDKVVLAVAAEGGETAQAELTPADAREIARRLEQAAGTGEHTPDG